MVIHRSSPFVTASGGKLYVCGGSKGGLTFEAIRSMERYDPETDMWEELEEIR